MNRACIDTRVKYRYQYLELSILLLLLKYVLIPKHRSKLLLINVCFYYNVSHSFEEKGEQKTFKSFANRTIVKK